MRCCSCCCCCGKWLCLVTATTMTLLAIIMFFMYTLLRLIHCPEMYLPVCSIHMVSKGLPKYAGYVQTDLPAAQSGQVTYHSNQCVCITLHAHSTVGQCSKASALLPPPPTFPLSLISLSGVNQGYAAQLLVACPCRAESQMACSPAGPYVSSLYVLCNYWL